MATVNIYFTYTPYTDVDSVYVVRSTTLKSEHAFQEALNNSSGGYDVLVNQSASTFSPGVYNIPDDTATADTQYWYCVAAKAAGTDAQFRVGLGENPSTVEVTPDTDLTGVPGTSVASVVAGSGTSSGYIGDGGGGDGGGGDGGGGGSGWGWPSGLPLVEEHEKSSMLRFEDANGNQISETSFKNEGYTDANIQAMWDAYVDAWNWMETLIGLPIHSEAQSIRSYLYLFINDSYFFTNPAAAIFQDGTAYTLSGSSTKTFGDYFPRVALVKLNAYYFVYKEHYQDYQFWFDVMKHEIAHCLGFTTGILYPQHSYYLLNEDHGFMGTHQTDGVNRYYWKGPNALAEYKSLIDNQLGMNSTGIVGIPMSDGFYPMNPHWKEGYLYDTGGLFPGEYVNIEGKDHPVLNREIMTPQPEPERMPLSRITAGYFEDMGYEVDKTACDVFDDLNPLISGGFPD